MTAGARQSGQAAVESALTLPLIVFLFLGTLQLGLLQQARILAQYAVFQATRVGATHQGACEPMSHAALLSLVPALSTFLGDEGGGATAGARLGAAFRRFKGNSYAGYLGAGWPSGGNADEAIVWLVREAPSPTLADVTDFDQPLPRASRGEPLRLDVRMIFWAPLRIPFADRVITQMVLAHFGLQGHFAMNPLMPAREAAWLPRDEKVLASAVADELLKRSGRGHYVFPVMVHSSQRMMSPPRLSEFSRPVCSAPGGPT